MSCCAKLGTVGVGNVLPIGTAVKFDYLFPSDPNRRYEHVIQRNGPYDATMLVRIFSGNTQEEVVREDAFVWETNKEIGVVAYKARSDRIDESAAPYSPDKVTLPVVDGISPRLSDERDLRAGIGLPHPAMVAWNEQLNWAVEHKSTP